MLAVNNNGASAPRANTKLRLTVLFLFFFKTEINRLIQTVVGEKDYDMN